MKTLSHLGFVAVVYVLASSSAALAGGIDAGTLIDNTASATYNTAGGPVTTQSNTVSLTVQEVLDVAVAPVDTSNVSSTGSTALRYTVTNTGNGPEAFVLTANPVVTGNDFDTTVTNLAIDTNGDGLYNAGIDTILANGGTTAVLDAGQEIKVFVLVNTPSSAQDAQTSKVNLEAVAATGSGTPGTVFSGQGVNGIDAIVGLSGAKKDANAGLVFSLATVTLTKSAVVLDPFGGSQPVPGATITYSIAATVSGSGTVTGLVINDPLPAQTDYIPNSLKLGSASLTDVSDADAGEHTTTGISVSLGTVSSGTSQTVSFQVKIRE